jgi:glutamate dehydrogenase
MGGGMAQLSVETGPTTPGELVAQAAALADPADPIAEHLSAYYWHVSDEDLLARRPEDLLGAASEHARLAQNRPVGTAAVRVYDPTSWATKHTVVDVVTDDMPFLVDSVTAELTRHERAIHLVVHPQLVVRRNAAGVLLEVLGLPSEGSLPYDCHIESWMHIEVERDSDSTEPEQLTAGLQRVLGDVRAAVEDWPRLRDRAAALADELATAPPASVPPTRSPRRSSCCSGWPTATSPSWATASTPSRWSTASTACAPAPARASASCATTSGWPAGPSGCRPPSGLGLATRAS